MLANEERGEVKFSVRGEEGVLCAEMQRLALVSSAVGTKSIRELMERIHSMEPMTIYNCVDALLVSGDAVAIKSKIRGIEDLPNVSGAIIRSMAIISPGDSKNVKGGTEKKA